MTDPVALTPDEGHHIGMAGRGGSGRLRVRVISGDLVTSRTEGQSLFEVVRPPWSQALTATESDRMIAAARVVGGEVEAWAVTAHYVQFALADQRDRFAMAMRRVTKRHPRHCGVIHGNKPKGWTCLDTKLDAELNEDRYTSDFGQRVRMGEQLCDVCVLREALDEYEPHPSFDLDSETADV